MHELAAGDHVIVEYDNSYGYADDVHIEHSERGVTIYIPTGVWRVWSSTGADITPRAPILNVACACGPIRPAIRVDAAVGRSRSDPEHHSNCERAVLGDGALTLVVDGEFFTLRMRPDGGVDYAW